MSDEGFVAVDVRRDGSARVLVGAVANRRAAGMGVGGFFIVFCTPLWRTNFEGVGVDVSGRIFVGVASVNLTVGTPVDVVLSETDRRTAVAAGRVMGESFPFCFTGVLSIEGINDLRTAPMLLFCS